jgi:hypothetical protein
MRSNRAKYLQESTSFHVSPLVVGRALGSHVFFVVFVVNERKHTMIYAAVAIIGILWAAPLVALVAGLVTEGRQ